MAIYTYVTNGEKKPLNKINHINKLNNIKVRFILFFVKTIVFYCIFSRTLHNHEIRNIYFG